MGNNKLKTLVLLNLLQRETDEEHPISGQAICELLGEQDITCERKSLYRDISLLTKYGMDIVKTHTPRPGFFLGRRDFETAEVRLLMDAVTTAPFITPQKTTELTEKLLGLLSRYQAEKVRRQVYVEQRVKFENEEIYNNIDALSNAIAKERKVDFLYSHRALTTAQAKSEEPRAFTVSPYALLWDNDKYYLVGNYEKYDDLSNYRLDRMKQVRVSEEPSRSFCEVCGYRDFFDTADYLRKTFHMYNGRQQTVKLRCDPSVMEAVADRFGSELKVLSGSAKGVTVRVSVYVSEGLVEWLLQYGGRVEALSPKSLREAVREKVRALAAAYKLL